jgi:F-actin monooxygenase
MSPEESVSLENIDIKTWLHYLEVVCEVFRGEIPHVKHPKLDYAEFKQKTITAKNTMADFARLHRIAAAKREASKEENGASHVISSGRRSQKIAEKLPSEFSIN